MEIDMVVISGFSGSGKGTILRELLSLHPEFDLIQSYTTRKKRNDTDFYSFVNVTEFLDLMKSGFFLECNKYSGEWYGTPVCSVQRCINNGKIAVVEVDSNGYRQIMESSWVKNFRILSVFVVADADTIIRRLLNRNTENLEKILLRLNSSLDECEWIEHYDFVLPNYDLNTSVTLLEKATRTGDYPHSTFNVDEYKYRMQHLIWLLSD